jgi:hypothetical protein
MKEIKEHIAKMPILDVKVALITVDFDISGMTDEELRELLAEEVKSEMFICRHDIDLKDTYNTLNEIKTLKETGVKNIGLNGFKESIDYVIQHKYADHEIEKVDKLNYKTTF